MKVKPPLITIIIPTYNVEEYIQECLNSVYRQCYQNIEIIVIDDSSTDATQQILLNNKKQNNILNTVFLPINIGPGKCRNTGLELSNGEYIFFLDADDYLGKDALEKLINFIPPSYDICIFNGISFKDKTKEILKKKYFNLHPSFFYRKKILKQYHSMLFDCHSPCLKIYSKNFLYKHKITFPENTYGEDVVFWIKCLMSTSKISYIDYSGYYRRVRDNSIMTSNSVKNIKDRLDSFKELLTLSLEDTDLYNYIISRYIPVTLRKIHSHQNDELIKYSRNTINDLIKEFK